MSGEGLVDLHGQPALRLRSPDGATAIVLLHGAQVVSWQPVLGGERLFLSPRSRWDEGCAVRGGIPVVFPQFSERGPLPKHGFARNRRWQPARVETGAEDALAVLQLADDDATRALWPHPFALELTLCLRGDRLDVELAVSNTGAEAFGFTAALHTYLSVGEVEAARLTGLAGRPYQDFVTGHAHVDAAEAVRIEEETDRIYFGADAPLQLADGNRRVRIEAAQFPDVVVWNPWQAKGDALPDLAPGDFRRFLCVEAALIERPLELAPGEQWWGRQTLLAG